MAGSPQNPRSRINAALHKGLPRGSTRPIWGGLAVALLGLSAAVYGAIVASRERTDRAPLGAMREGLTLLAIERDVSVVAANLIATLTMQMYEGGHEAGLAARLDSFHVSIEDAAERLDAAPPSDGWRQTHDGMREAVRSALDTWSEERTNNELQSWLTEFLYDYKLVIPTDNVGHWSALLEAATWSQEVPLVFEDYLDVAMAREWRETGRPPADPDLTDAYGVSLSSMRQLRESHGAAAAEYTPFEEYILLDVARDADSTTFRLMTELAQEEGVQRLEADMPYLLSLTDERGFESVDEIYALREGWIPEVTEIIEAIRSHARDRLDEAVRVSVRRERVAGWGAIIAVVFAVLYGVTLIRRRLKLDTILRSALERDPLTELANRYALFSTAPKRLADPDLLNFALIHVDLDDFKSINDDYGHHVGDSALVAFAGALSGAVRAATDLVCRVGGDEFVVLLHRLAEPEEEATAIVERLRDALQSSVEVDGVSLQLHFTAGIAVAREAAQLDELLVEADLALLDAKERGRDVARFFRRKLGRRMIHELSTALGTGELRCAFQPQLDLDTGDVIGLEALARWHRDDRLEVPARSLIDALEWLGASRDWLRAAMSDIEGAWHAVGERVDGRIWLNLMGCDLEGAEAAELLEIFSGTSVPLDRIGLEITEAVGRTRIGDAADVLERLRDEGLAIALDDVGDDRVPLLHVTELPIDLVKLDRCVITGIDSQQPLRAVVRSLADMCDRLGLRILAEGVETFEEEAVLRELGIRYVQGFRFSRPLALPALQSFVLADWRVAAGDSVA